MFWGTGSGSASKTLRHMEENDVLISYTTTQEPWSGIDNLFIDSGGYSLMLETGEHGSVSDYFEYVEDVGAEVVALQDYPCEPEILSEYDRTVKEHQERTLERAAENLAYIQDHNVSAKPMTVLQGWELGDYVECIDRYREAGVLTDYIGIGSVCRRNAESKIRKIVTTVAENLPNKKLHAFGVKQSILNFSDVRDALNSVDSSAWYQRMYQGKPDAEPAWHTTTKMYLEYKRKLYQQFNIDVVSRDGQETMEAWT